MVSAAALARPKSGTALPVWLARPPPTVSQQARGPRDPRRTPPCPHPPWSRAASCLPWTTGLLAGRRMYGRLRSCSWARAEAWGRARVRGGREEWGSRGAAEAAWGRRRGVRRATGRWAALAVVLDGRRQVAAMRCAWWASLVSGEDGAGQQGVGSTKCTPSWTRWRAWRRDPCSTCVGHASPVNAFTQRRSMCPGLPRARPSCYAHGAVTITLSIPHVHQDAA